MSRTSLAAKALVAYGAHLPDHPRKWWLHQKLRKSLGVRVHGRHEVERLGLRWSLTPEEHSHGSLYWLAVRDRWELLHLSRLVPKNGTVIDAGSNYGYYALRIAQGLSGQGRVHALEPNPTNFANLERNIALNPCGIRVTAHQVGVSDVPGTFGMVDDVENMGHSWIGGEGQGVQVEVTTLDRFVDSNVPSRVDVLIVDVEGFEERAIRGGIRTIERDHPLVFVELWPPTMKRQGTSPEQVAALLLGLGYVLFKPVRDELRLLDQLPRGVDGVNCFAYHRDSIPESLKSIV